MGSAYFSKKLQDGMGYMNWWKMSEGTHENSNLNKKGNQN